MLEPGVDETVRAVVEHASRRVRRGMWTEVPAAEQSGRAAVDLESGVASVSDQRLIGAHLPAMHPERRETRPGRCSGCRTRFAVDARLPLPVTCPDCGGDVVAAGEVSQ